MVDPMTKCSIHAAQEAVASNLDSVERLLDGVNRGIDLTDRISKMYKPDDKVSDEIIEYIQHYESVCGEVGWPCIKIDASCESALDIVKSIVRAVWSMICKIWDKIVSCFKWLFNAQYRASRDAVKCCESIARLNNDREAREKFMRYDAGGMLSPDDLNNYMNSTSRLISFMEDIPKHKDPEDLVSYITSGCGDCGLVYKDSKFCNTYVNLPFKEGTYASVGWKDVAQILKTAQSYIELTRKTVKLKKIEGDLNADISDLRRKQDKRIASGDDLSDVQKELMSKCTMYTFVNEGLKAMMERIAVLEDIFAQIAEDADDIRTGNYEKSDDDD